MPYTIFIKEVIVGVRHLYRTNAYVRISLCKILIAIKLKPCVHEICACPIVSDAIGCSNECAASENKILKCIGASCNCLLSVNSKCSFGIEVIVITVYLMPTCHQFTYLRVAYFITVNNESCILCLTVIYTVITKVIIVSINLMYTVKLFTIYIVNKSTILDVPAFLNSIFCQSIVILECGVHTTERCAGFLRIVGIYKRSQAKDFLIFRFLCKRVKCICTEECIIAQFTIVNDIENVLSSPNNSLLGSKLNSLHHAKRICCYRINRLSLVDPIELKCKSIGSFIKRLSCEAEILIHD